MTRSNLNQLTEHVYWLAPDATTDRPVLGAILGNKGALIVDAGNSPAHANLLLEGLTQLAEPKYVALTHWHWDHVFGTAAFDIPIVAHEETKRIVEQMAQLDWSDSALDRRVAEGTEIGFCRDMMKAELPERSHLRLKTADISFGTQIELDMGGISCQIRHVGGDHSSDSSVVYVRGDNVLFLGDCLYEDLHHGPRRYTTQKLFPLINLLLAYGADYYLLGHDLEPMSRQQMVEYTGLLRSIGQEVERLGDDRERIIQSRQQSTGRPLEKEHLEIVDAFLAGLQRR
jgi:glyoxylase-like metal-dependent hydrolase (beta-lactamase superfamily II)